MLEVLSNIAQDWHIHGHKLSIQLLMLENACNAHASAWYGLDLHRVNEVSY
jgi:hypothetical protein